MKCVELLRKTKFTPTVALLLDEHTQQLREQHRGTFLLIVDFLGNMINASFDLEL